VTIQEHIASAPTVPPASSLVAEGTYLDTFNAYSLSHAVVMLFITVAVVGACVLGRRWRGTPTERNFRLSWSLGIVVFQAYAIVWFLLPGNMDVRESLPLHLCDLAVWVAAIALVTQWRPMRAVLYFWAIGLSTQAFFTPVLQEGVTHPKFWFFWVGHTQIVGSAIYDVIALRFRPTVKDYLHGTVANVLYAALVLPINLVFGLNYGYIGAVLPETQTILHKLPETYVLRLLSIFVIVQTVTTALWLVWPAARLITGSRGDPPAEPLPA